MDWNGLLNFQDDPKRNMLMQVGLGLLAGNQSGNPALGAMRGFQNAQEIQNAMQRQKFLEEQIRMQKQDQEWQNQQRQRQAEQQQRQQELVGRLPQMLGVNPDVLAAYPELGQKLVERTMFPAQPEVDKVSPDKYTPESLAKFRQSGDYSQLVPVADKGSVPSAIQEYNLAKEQGFKGTFFDFQAALKKAGASNTTVSYGAPVAGVDANNNPIFFQPSKDGGAPAIIPGVAPKPEVKQPTEAQSKAGTFHSQMVNASKELSKLEQEGYNPSTFSSQVGTAAASGLGNLVVGADSQRARQAQNQWAEAFLRVKTGAAATKDEVKLNVETFFPQPGEGPEVVEQKRRARAQAEQDVLNMTQNPNNIVPRGAQMPSKKSDMSSGGWSVRKVK